MQFDVWSRNLAREGTDCLMLGVFEDGEPGEAAREIDEASGGRIAGLLKRGDFAGRVGESVLLADLPGVRASRVLLVGLGARKSFARRAWRRALAAGFAAVARTRIRSVAVAVDRPADPHLDDYYAGRAVAELAGAALYRVNDLKSGKKPRPHALERVLVGPASGAAATAAKRGLEHGRGVSLGMKVQRDLGNLPGNVCTPTYLASEAKAIGRRYRSVRVQVLDEAAMRRLGMGCLLSVAAGSEQPPRFVVMDYRGGRSTKDPIVLVGKGITFDTGGISLKDPGGMDEMKYDMSGAAAVLSCITLAAELKLPIRVVGLVAASENMPSGRATKPGDIVRSASGQTVEILNTDAEGRLVLCDALTYARRFEPSAVIDIATLTGACVIALGAHHSGLLGNDDDLAKELLEAGVRADDRAWQLPLTEEYAEQLKSNFADFANVGGREAGTITAAAFLGKFTQGLKWAHLDIAGTAWVGGAQKGSTGRPVPLLADFLIRRAGL